MLASPFREWQQLQTLDTPMLWCVQRLSCGPAEHEAAVGALLAGRTEMLKQHKLLTEELAQLHGIRIATQLPAAGDQVVKVHHSPCQSLLCMTCVR